MASTKRLSFFQTAELQAEIQVREWIRTALRETFLQVFKKNLTLGEDGVSVQLENLGDCLDMVRRVSEAWQDELRKQDHGLTAAWVENVHVHGKADLWSQAISPTETLPAETGKGSLKVEESINAQDQKTEMADASVEAASFCADIKETSVIPYCELRRLVRPHLKQPNEFPDAVDPNLFLKEIGKRGVSHCPLHSEVIDGLVEEIPKRQRRERTGERGFELEVIVPGADIIDGKEDTTEVDEESKNILSQVLARSKSKLKAPRFKRKRLQEAKKHAQAISEVPRPASTIGSASYHIINSLTASEKEDALRYVSSDMDATDPASLVCIFGALKDLGQTYGEKLEKDTKRPNVPKDEKTRRRRVAAYARQRIFPRRLQDNNEPGKYKSKVYRTEQDTEDGVVESFLDFDLGWTFVEYKDNTGAKRLMIFSSLEVTLKEAH